MFFLKFFFINFGRLRLKSIRIHDNGKWIVTQNFRNWSITKNTVWFELSLLITILDPDPINRASGLKCTPYLDDELSRFLFKCRAQFFRIRGRPKSKSFNLIIYKFFSLFFQFVIKRLRIKELPKKVHLMPEG